MLEKTGSYLGICYGLHAVVIDVARNCVGLAGAHSAEISESRAPSYRFDN